MRKIILDTTISLDGYYTSPNPIFVDQNARHKLKLISARTFQNGVVALHYEPAGACHWAIASSMLRKSLDLLGQSRCVRPW
jgi:hypothetical protein